MKLEITLRELAPVIQSMNNFVEVPLPAKHSWRLSRVMKKLQEDIQDFNTSRQELFDKYGTEAKMTDEQAKMASPGSKAIQITEENREVFAKELDELLNETIEIEFEPIPISMFADSNLSIADMANLEMFFDDDISEVEEKMPTPEEIVASTQNI